MLLSLHEVFKKETKIGLIEILNSYLLIYIHQFYLIIMINIQLN
jgi:hypothetical protein